MITPLESRPNITQTDIVRGYVTRYFTQLNSTRKIYEINKEQYNIFLNDPYYVTIQLPWIIVDLTSNSDSREYITNRNSKIVEHFNNKMQGLNRKLRNFDEYIQIS